MIEQVALAALVAWCLQLALAYWQARRFYRDVSRLRRLGPCATAMAGGRYRGRTYVVLVAHPKRRAILAARQLSGFTVFARLRPLPQVEGRPLDELLVPETLGALGLKPRLSEAVRSAAGTLQEAIERQKTGVASGESVLPPRTSLQPLA
jgi:glucitol operon activator protein